MSLDQRSSVVRELENVTLLGILAVTLAFA